MSELIEKLIAAAREYGADASLETANAEMDAQIALFAALGRKDEEYRQLCAEVERLSGIIREAEWSDMTMVDNRAYLFAPACPICETEKGGVHSDYCQFYQWEGTK